MEPRALKGRPESHKGKEKSATSVARENARTGGNVLLTARGGA